MANKKKRTKYVSKGERTNVANTFPKTEQDKVLGKLKAKLRGKPVKESIPNPDKSQTNKRFIRV